MERPDWDSYFMEIAQIVSKRSTCLRRAVGAVLVKDKQILATGYNGTPKGLPHCEEVGCLREQLHVPSGQMHELCRGIHAEQNSVIQAAVNGVSISGSTLYCTHQPCVVCSKILINAGIKRIVYANPYPDKLAAEMMHEAGNIEMVVFTEKTEKATGKK
jgi:dCMP deaminase